MKFSHPLPTAIFGAAMVSSTIVAMQFATPVALAADVREIAREITVRIDGPGAGGSGFIVKREDDFYTVVTNWHVVDRQGEYTVKTEDGREHRVRYRNIQQLPGADLAVMYFTSSERYRVAELGDSNDVRETDAVYVAGWMNPLSDAIRQPAYSLIQGQITAVQSPNDGGYALVYNTTGNYKGMSGGPVLNDDGKVVGVNGQGISDPVNGMVGLYLGIPINTFEGLQARVSPPANTERAEAFWRQGNEHLDEQDYQSAIEDYNQAIRLNPEYAFAYNSRGIAYRNQGNLERAIADYNESLRLNNSEPWIVYNNRGNAYRNQGDLERAIADYNQAIRLNPEYASAYYNRGNAYYNQGDLERAIADYDQAIRLNPDFALAYNNRGLAYRNQGNLERAIADYNQAIRLNPEYASAYYNRGNVYYKQGDLERAIADYNQAIRLNPEYAHAYNNRGFAYYKQGDLEKAIADYNQAIRINPEYALAYNNRGWAYSQQGNNRQALENLRKAAELYQQQGNQEDYQNALERIRELE